MGEVLLAFSLVTLVILIIYIKSKKVKTSINYNNQKKYNKNSYPYQTNLNQIPPNYYQNNNISYDENSLNILKDHQFVTENFHLFSFYRHANHIFFIS